MFSLSRYQKRDKCARKYLWSNSYFRSWSQSNLHISHIGINQVLQTALLLSLLTLKKQTFKTKGLSKLTWKKKKLVLRMFSQAKLTNATYTFLLRYTCKNQSHFIYDTLFIIKVIKFYCFMGLVRPNIVTSFFPRKTRSLYIMTFKRRKISLQALVLLLSAKLEMQLC